MTNTSLKKNTMTKKKLINSISQKKGIHPNDVRHVVQAFLDEMSESLSNGNRIEFRDFGVFDIVNRKAKVGRNPKKAEVAIHIPERRAVKFQLGKRLKKEIQNVEPTC